MPKQLTESRPLAVESAKSGRLSIGLITPGWGSSGYYSAKVLENAAAARVFPAGTQMFLDHPGEAELHDRPERSVRDLAAVLTTDATWDGKRLAGEAQVFGPYIDLLTDETFAETIGVSIRALAEATLGEAEGRRGQIITELVEAESVDFVTKAGRGGSILAVLESARPSRVNARAVDRGVQEATANDTREALAAAVKDSYGGEETWLYVRDFDESTVWFDLETPDSHTTYAQAYEQGDGSVSLTGEPVEVRATTVYVPVTAAESGPADVPAPAGRNTTHPDRPEEDTIMGHIQVDEAEHGRLTEAAGRVPTLESERDTAVRERDEARAELAELREADARRSREAAAGRIIDEQSSTGGVSFTKLERAGLLAALPVTESGDLDAEAFTSTVAEAVAEKGAESGLGRIRGFGATSTTSESDTDTVEAAESARRAAFGRDPKGA